MSKYKIFTHTDLDGIGCVILAYLAFGGENVDVEYCNYDDVDEKVEAFVEQEELFKSYDKVYITDISISDAVANLIDILDCPPKKVRLFDHHATALGLNRYGWCNVMVAIQGGKTCGTELFWKHLNHYGYFDELSIESLKNLADFVQIVRDYDTWRWKELGEEGVICKQVNDLFYMYGREEFIGWAMDQIRGDLNISPLFDDIFPRFSTTDRVLLSQKQRDIDRYIEKKDKQLTVNKDQFGYTYGVIFAEQYFSELGNRLCELHPELDYVAMIDIADGKVSYRTIREDLDVGGTIAHSFGGGGHPKAAGSVFDGELIRADVVNQVLSSKGIL